MSSVPGTTRDPVDTELIFDNILVLVDTALGSGASPRPATASSATA